MYQNIGLHTAEMLPKRSTDFALKYLHSAIYAHANHRLTISLIDAHLEFSSKETRDLIDIVTMLFNFIDVDAKNHPSERSIRAMKERVFCIIQSLPFQYLPKVIIVSSVHEDISKINRCPLPKRVSFTLSSITIGTNAANFDTILPR